MTVGKAESQWKARLSTRGTFDVLDASDAVVTQMGTDSDGAYLTTAKSALTLRSQRGNAVVTVGNGVVNLSSEYGVAAGLSVRRSNAIPYAGTVLKGMLPGATCLYASSSGTTGTVALRNSVGLFWRIDVHFDDGTGRVSVTSVVGPPSGGSGVGVITDGTKASIGRSVGNVSANGVYVSGEVITLAGSTITRGGGRQASIVGSSANVGGADHYIKAVVGWIA